MNRTIKKISFILTIIIMLVLMIRYNIVSNATEVLNVETLEDSENLVSQMEEINIEASQSTEGILESASAIDLPYGNEIVNISENVSAIDNLETEYSVRTPTETDTIISTINTYLDTYVNNPNGSEADSVGSDIEKWLKENIYTLPNIASVEYGENLNSYNKDAIITFPHDSSEKRNMNDYVNFSNSTWYGFAPKLEYNPTIFKEIYDNYEGESNNDISTQVAYSNYNAKRIYPYWEIGSIIGTNELKNLDNHYDPQYSNADSIPYILAFLNKGTEDFTTSPSEAQKALWGATGKSSYQNEKLYKAAKAVEYFINVEEKNHPTSLTIKMPKGAEVGTVYSVTKSDLDAMYEKLGGPGFIGEPDTQPEITFDKTPKVKVGPFVMGDYAYAISEYVEDYSGILKGTKSKIKWPSVIAGIVGGKITLDDGTVIEIGEGSETTAKICYTDWYNNVPYDYVNQEFGKTTGDVRGEFRGSNDNYVTKPQIKGNYGESNDWDEKGAKTKTSMGNSPSQVSDLGITINEGGKQVDYVFPLPYSTFYIEIPLSACGAGNVLKSISFDYRTTEVTGEGDVIIVRAAKTTTSFSETKNYNIVEGIIGSEETIENACTTYTHSQGCYCKGGHKSSNCHACNCDDYCILDCTSDHHTSSCWTQKTCNSTDANHVHTDSCSGKELTCTTSHSHSKPDCYKCCTCSGHYWTYGGTTCDGTCVCDGHSETEYCELNGTWAYCVHGHRDCERGYWETEIGPDGVNIENGTAYGQPFVRIEKANVRVGTYTETKTVNVRLFTRIDREAYIVFVWHGWDEGFTYGDNEGKSGFFDFSELAITEPRPAELGDRVTYKVSFSNKTSDDYYIYVRMQYPDGIVANDLTNVKARTLDIFDSGSALINKFFNVDLIKTTYVNPTAYTMQNIVVSGWGRTGSAKILLRDHDTVNFFITFTFTDDWAYNEETGEYDSLFPTLTSRDGKEKSTTDLTQDFAKLPQYNNIDFIRTNYNSSDPRHNGPVMTKLGPWIPRPPMHKEYTLGINKYIYDVEHVDTTSQYTTMTKTEERGYNSDGAITNNTLSLAEIQDRFDKQEDKKKDNPVYVEYGDKVTYKIELYNTTIKERDDKPYYTPDKIYVTLIDELPYKYSDFEYTIESIGEEGPEEQKEHLQVDEPPDESISDTQKQKITFRDIMIPKNGKTTITISLVVEEHKKETIEENKAYVDPTADVYNFNRGDKKEPQNIKICKITRHTKITGESSDWYKLNDYTVDIDKYVSSYRSKVHEDNEKLKLTEEEPIIETAGLASFFENNKILTKNNQAENEDFTRKGMSDADKNNDPVQVEKGDDLIYSIKLQNLSQGTGNEMPGATKEKTQVRVSKVIEEIHPGLQIQDVKAYIYYSSGTLKRDLTKDYLTVTPTPGGTATRYEFKLNHKYETLLQPDEFVVFYVRVKVTESNMSLEKLYNNATLAVLTNINAPENTNADSKPDEARVIKEEKDGGYNENTITTSKNSDYVRMKDLVISGKVWLDKDRNGKMDGGDAALLEEKEPLLYKVNPSNAGKAGVIVRLYREGSEEPVRSTVTDANGFYTFSRDENGKYRTNSFESSGLNISGGPYQRIDKAGPKDSFGNYDSSSRFINYYIEFEYDGVLYKSTELYSRDSYDDLNKADDGKTNLDKDGSGNFNDTYKIDSNAMEKKAERERFNDLYEYISYNSAYNLDKKTFSGTLDFEKEDNKSLLYEKSSRTVRATSFINDYTDADNYLWLYPYKSRGSALPNTEYLKYINLGLELREEVDIAMTKDVYKVKTTINGETMEYDFNKNNTLNGSNSELGGNPTGTGGYLGDFIIGKPYGLELYEYDYKYRADQYFSNEVRNYKGVASELNVEVTYRITVDNKEISDDDFVKEKLEEKGKNYVTDKKLKVKVNEIMDVYEENFIGLDEKSGNVITVKEKDSNGILKDTNVKTIEAWYFEPVDSIPDGKEGYYIENESSGEKAIYAKGVVEGKQKYVKHELTLDKTPYFNVVQNNTIDYDEEDDDYGYDRLFITGMDDIYIDEGESFDIYIKYTLDKGETTVNIDTTTYSNTTSSKTVKEGSAAFPGEDTYGTYTHTIVVDEKNGVATMQRSLKIKDIEADVRQNPRGLENIAQVYAYSVWYGINDPASLVDRNSNAGNLAFKSGVSPDDITQYEDTTYKTGIVIAADETGWDKKTVTKIEEYKEIEFGITGDLERQMNGFVWDDIRNSTLGTEPEVQYIGDGKFNTARLSNEDYEKLANPNVEYNYRQAQLIKENRDFGIDNVKAEFIEIVKMEEPTSETGFKYYEQVLEEVTWKQKQYTRTGYVIDENGNSVHESGAYELYGYIPGTYIVRFTYGDIVEANEGKAPANFNSTIQAQKDMLIFNGQDYKSTKFGTNVTDNTTDVDEIIAALEVSNSSDARDDERRRLEVNSYSEVMTNEKAEILKGVGNGTQTMIGKYLTTNQNKNDKKELYELVNNTYMYADTIEFLVKAEKLTEDQQKVRKNIPAESILGLEDILYNEVSAMKNSEITERKFEISNIDMGIEYRPESEIRLIKEIEEVKLITEDGETLVDLFFLTKGDGASTEHVIDESRSKGIESVQFITNEYNLLLEKLTNEEKQGFVFVQIDEEILQGCTVQIIYKFEAENNSEVDRISKYLDRIRYKENKATKTLLSKYKTAETLAKTNYTASGVAAKAVEEETYRKDAQNLEYRIRPKTMVTNSMVDLNDPENTEELDKAYYGRFVGYSYYTGIKSDVLDTVASLKFDKILDYVDVNLEYKQESEQANTLDKFWTKVKTEDLKTFLYPVRNGYKTINKALTEPVPQSMQLQNGRGYTYDTLLVSVDDRIKDDKYSTKYSSFQVDSAEDNIRNNDLSRFLLPKDTAKDPTTGEYIEDQIPKAVATIRLPVSKVLSAEADKRDMSYENLAEIIQFTTLTGRRTNFATTIGNADITTDFKKLPMVFPNITNPNAIPVTLEFATSMLEPDTAATETVTLIPPTGLMRNRRAIVNIVEATSVGVGFIFILGTIAVILIIIITTILFVIRKYKKRRII